MRWCDMQDCPAFQTFSCCCPSSSLAGKGARFWLLPPGLLPISPDNCLARSARIPARVLNIQPQTFMAQLPMHLISKIGDSAVAQLQQEQLFMTCTLTWMPGRYTVILPTTPDVAGIAFRCFRPL